MPLHSDKPNVHFNFSVAISLGERKRLKFFLIRIFKEEKQQLADLQYVFCSDEFLLEINRQFLEHDYYTDIITFYLTEKGQPLVAEIYISVDRIRENAKEFNTTQIQELHRVIFHGALHLCGYRDKTNEEKVIMEKMEDKYLRLYFKDQNVPREKRPRPRKK